MLCRAIACVASAQHTCLLPRVRAGVCMRARAQDLIEAVRRMSPTRSTPSLSHSQPLPRKSSSAASLPDDSKVSGADREVLLLEEGVNANARRFNVLKMQADTKQKELDHLLVRAARCAAPPAAPHRARAIRTRWRS